VTRTLFVSDLHLTVEDEPKLVRFEALLDDRLRPGDSLYLLGDVFEYWISNEFVREPLYDRLIRKLAGFRRRGVSMGFIPGNRDFLIDRVFTRRTGVEWLGHRAQIELEGKRVHLEHGDLIYSRSWAHVAYRNLMRLSLLQEAIVRFPARIGHALGRSLRKASERRSRYVDWDRKELIELARPVLDRGIDVFVFGHIHEPHRIDLEHRGRPCTLIALGDWNSTGTYLEHEAGSFELRKGW
jgi:UDP-2,3-diacylglucosamine hydrolase